MDIFRNISKILGNVFGKPEAYSAKELQTATPDDAQFLRQFGATVAGISEAVSEALNVSSERTALYNELENARSHPIIDGALNLYVSSASSMSPTQDASVWITSDSATYKNVLETMLDNIGIEDIISDWAFCVAHLGDLFVEPILMPGHGIISIDDSRHPGEISRVDLNGRLIGFHDNNIGVNNTVPLKSPWSYVHFRKLGSRHRRLIGQEAYHGSQGNISMLSVDNRRINTKYGESIISSALPIYKRLKIAEDVVLMASTSKRPLKYLYKLKVDGRNPDKVATRVDNYATLLKRARVLDTTPGGGNFKNNLSDLTYLEDVIIPVWESVGDLTIDKLGGEVDIRYLADLDEWRNQLAVALSTPLSLLGGYTKDIPSSIGSSSADRLDIRFGKRAYALQRALRVGITRLCQIHLAYLGMDPDPNFFTVHMNETSSAEDVEIKEALKEGVGIVSDLADVIHKFSPDVDSEKLFDYLNKKFLKLGDLDLNSMKNNNNPSGIIRESVNKPLIKSTCDILTSSELKALVPTEQGKQIWESKYKHIQIKQGGHLYE